MIKTAQSQYDAAQQVLAATQAGGNAAMARLQGVLAEMTRAANELRESRAESISLTKDLTEIEEDILAEQSSDTPYAKLFEEIRKTKRDLAAAEARITGDAAFIRELERLKQEKGAGAAIEFRQFSLNTDLEYAGLHAELVAAVDKQTKLKRELFEKDPEWQSTHDLLLESHKAEHAASAEVHHHAPERAAPKRDIKDAQQASEAARAAMAQAEQVLRSLGSSPKTAGSSKTKK